MITNWLTLPILLGTRQIAEINAKLDITYRKDWTVCAVIIEDDNGKEVRIEADGTVASGDKRECSLMGPALIAMAHHYFSLNRDDLLAEFGIKNAA